MPTVADNEIVDRRVAQACQRLAGSRGETSRAVIQGWTGWVGCWTSDWEAFSASAASRVERALTAAARTGRGA